MEKKINFSIIAHIDHGKSTLADRLLETCHAVEKRKMQNQLLDNLEVERERGITVKSQTVRLNYLYNNEKYALNLIDTPGHVDFSFEVRRALAASDGAIVLVDASQGVEAQTIANVYRAMEEGVTLVPVINKIDLPGAQVEAVSQQLVDVLGIDDEPILISAKTGIGIEELLSELVKRIPPIISEETDFKALLIDSWFDIYLGVVLLVKVQSGTIKLNESFKFHSKESIFKIEKLGYLRPQIEYIQELTAGDVGIIIGNIRNVKDCSVGDTLTHINYLGPPLKSFPPQKAVVFCGMFPTDASDYQELKDAIEKLALNDASLVIEPTHSPALGVGFRCGFLGLLHLEVIQQRLEQEFDMNVVITAPTVEYIVIQTNDETLKVHDASFMPETPKIKQVLEPWVKVTIFSPEDYLGEIIKLCLEKRARNQQIVYLNKIGTQQNISCLYEIPLSEIIFDFHDKLKSLSKGYASFDYESCGNKETEVVVVNILVNATKVDSLATIVHKDSAEAYGRYAVQKLKEEISRELFAIALQAAIGGKIIARETVSALRKDVTAKCYGGDVTRKKKLLEKQKEGKKRMKEMSVGRVTIPNSAMLKILKRT
ncbi:translation elongation factor 4 [Alphaproteobacteria bacterium endosymbiont of Tiliacea citrago]|uniref:translation elongation factor 4 n=1 Tax=Alphaproteobacteria bacterium endosymbiont of Tiliacea citrago TaxID=3077944 RepID=UPI00313B46F3